MKTILGMPYTPPTPDELEALMRQAHRERAEAIRDALRSLFGWRREGKVEPPAIYASLRPSL
jgi:hypothetical protein